MYKCNEKSLASCMWFYVNLYNQKMVEVLVKCKRSMLPEIKILYIYIYFLVFLLSVEALLVGRL
jgi:hypothetical protein